MIEPLDLLVISLNHSIVMISARPLLLAFFQFT